MERLQEEKEEEDGEVEEEEEEEEDRRKKRKTNRKKKKKEEKKRKKNKKNNTYIKYSIANRTCHWIPPISVEVYGFSHSGCYFWSGNHSSHGKPIADAFSHGH